MPYFPIKSAPLPHFGQAAADLRTSEQTGADAAHTILCLFRQYCADDITKIPNFAKEACVRLIRGFYRRCNSKFFLIKST